MARPGSSVNRITEELEQLEQRITLTLQEIDHNFSRAHRIVTSGILPIVEKYGEHSSNVWEASKFWKQFFEASANVSLSGYEEAVLEETVTDTIATATTDDSQTTQEDSSYATPTTHPGADDDTVVGLQREEGTGVDSIVASLLDSPSAGTHSTPRAPRTAERQPKTPTTAIGADFTEDDLDLGYSPTDDPETPVDRTQRNLFGKTPGSAAPPSTIGRRTQNDPLLHRVLDKTYRIQATPHKGPGAKIKPKDATTPATTHRSRFLDEIDSPDSPALQAPQLRSDLFSPMKRNIIRTPKTPGVSVLTPAKGVKSSGAPGEANAHRTDWEDGSDEEDSDPGMSPPKTIQFHIPQRTLLQTPAREASKRIVEGLLLTAGGDITQETEDSPSVIKRDFDLDDSF